MKGCYIFFFWGGGGGYQCFHEKQVDIKVSRGLTEDL